MTKTKRFAAFSLLWCSLAVAQAQDVGQHPAVFAPRALPQVDVSTFIVGHPASPTTRGGHANADHPAVLISRAAVSPTIQADTFIVAPPASTRWTSNTETEAATVVDAALLSQR